MSSERPLDSISLTLVSGQVSENPLYQTFFGAGKLSKGEKKKLDIVEAAVELFGQQGVDRTSIEHIAKQMGISRSHVSYHFADMDILIEAAILQMMSKGVGFTFELMAGAKPGQQQFQRYLRGYFGFFAENPVYIPVMMYFIYASSFLPRFKVLQTQTRLQASGRIRELLIQLYIEANKRIPIKINALSSQVQSLIFTGLVYCLTTGEGSPAERLVETESRVFEDTLMICKLKGSV